MEQDIRWKQRFSNFEKAFLQLKQAVEDYDGDVEAIIKEGVIQRFKYTHELTWKVMKDFLEYEGHQNITGSRSATRSAFNINLVKDGQVWMDMIDSRNKTVHTYHKNILEQEYQKVVEAYFSCFSEFYKKMKTLI